MTVRRGHLLRRSWTLAALAALVAAGVTQPAVAAPAAPAKAAPRVPVAKSAPAWLAQLQRHTVRYVRSGHSGPVGVDPATALVPRPEDVDWGGWRRRHAAPASAQRTAARAAARTAARSAAAAPAPLTVREDEPAGTRGSNDTLPTAQRIPAFGTGTGRNPAATVLGRLSPEQLPPGAIEPVPPNQEPDSQPETARDTGVSQVRRGISTTGVLGDEAPEPGQPEYADSDFYKFTLRAGEQLRFVETATGGTLEPTAILIDSNFNLVAFSDDTLTTATLDTTVRSAGDYYVIATGWTIIDLGTGEVTLPEGPYSVTASARAGDRDLYAVNLKAGDVLGVSVADAAGYVSVFDSAGTEVHGSPQDATYLYPLQSPLPGGGNAVTDHVVRATGRHYVEVTSGDGTYQATVEVYRSGGAGTRRTQTVYLDTDGQRLNTGIFGGRGVTTLSPLRAFLGRWGLTRGQERALVDRVKATVRENLIADLKAAGLSDTVDVKVVSSLDGPDPFGQAGVTRVVVGGTIDESGVPTIGIAQSIDPGNFGREETALVLLDLLSDPGDELEAPYSLNTYLGPGSNRVKFVGRAVGNVVSHEVGHLVGNWHVEPFNTTANLMDSGGNFPVLFGVGPDGVGGTADDVDVDFGRDVFDTFEGFTGVEDTLARSVWGMSRKA